MQIIEVNGSENRVLPKAVYNQCVWVVRDYERLKQMSATQGQTFCCIAFYSDGKAGLISADTIKEAVRRARCVEESLLAVPEEFREGIYLNIKEGRRYAEFASTNTWKKWKRRFIYKLAEKLNLY